MAQVETTTEFLTEVVDYVEKVSAIQEKQAQDYQQVTVEAKTALDILKKAGLCDPSASDEDLAAKLEDHAMALKTLGKLAQLIPPPSMGEPGTTKEAGVNDSDMKESDAVLLRGLGFDV